MLIAPDFFFKIIGSRERVETKLRGWAGSEAHHSECSTRVSAPQPSLIRVSSYLKQTQTHALRACVCVCFKYDDHQVVLKIHALNFFPLEFPI